MHVVKPAPLISTPQGGTTVGGDGTVWQTFSSGPTRVAFRIEGNALENVIVGHMDGPVAARLIHEFDGIVAVHGSCIGLHWWWDAPTYTSEYRALWMDWLARQSREGLPLETHFFTSSRIVRMGLAVANVAYAKIRFGIYDNEADYIALRRRFMKDAAPPKL